jgi:hypothetical protein
MNTATRKNDLSPRAVKVWFEEDFICLQLTDGREVKTPIVFYPRLLQATPEQRNAFTMSGGGKGLHWEEIDEDLTVEGIAHGRIAVF